MQRQLPLTNSGLNPASFRVEVEAGLPIQVTPADGKLDPKGAPGASISLKVELTAEISGPLSGQSGFTDVPLFACTAASARSDLVLLLHQLWHLIVVHIMTVAQRIYCAHISAAACKRL